jgi:hypothetical protein
MLRLMKFTLAIITLVLMILSPWIVVACIHDRRRWRKRSN